jgi:hypothetical protein
VSAEEVRRQPPFLFYDHGVYTCTRGEFSVGVNAWGISLRLGRHWFRFAVIVR